MQKKIRRDAKGIRPGKAGGEMTTLQLRQVKYR